MEPGLSKQQLRQELIDRRRQFSAEYIDEASAGITARLLNEFDSGIKSLHLFLPIEKNNEIDTWQFLKDIWEKYPGVLTAVPQIYGHTLESVEVNKITKFERDSFGAPVPTDGKRLASGFQFDVIYVP
jgi:5-formyltetrahydrofolate cyclo-ligase